MGARSRSRVRPAAAVLLGASALLIAACGGSSSMSPRSASASGGPIAFHRDVVSSGAVTRRAIPGTGGSATNEESPGKVGEAVNGKSPGRVDSGQGGAGAQTNPCRLVSKAQAQAILGRPIADPQEASLGPTCIYEPLGSKRFTTLTVESIDFAKLRGEIRNLKRVGLGGRAAAYCGDFGEPTTFVPLAHGRVLNVTAPCAVGVRFAARALPRLGGG
jgi:hypothetical protein